MCDAILLSVKPKYARKIFEGSKTVELRRVLPKIAKGSLVFLYASSPVKAILGAFLVDRVVASTPEELWPLVRNSAGVSREEFDSYYHGAEQGVGIFVGSVRSADTPFELDELRKYWPEFRPPQGYRYIRTLKDQEAVLLKGVGWLRDRPSPKGGG